MAKTTICWGISLTPQQLELLRKVKQESGVNVSQLLIRSFLKCYGSEAQKK